MSDNSYLKRLKKRLTLLKQALFLPELNFDLEKQRRKTKRDRMIILILIVVIFLGLILFLVQKKIELNSLNAFDDSSIQSLEESISNVIKVDSSEKPTVAQITDIDNLKKQNPSLYTDAENDDLIIIYPDTAIIYRPSLNKIITIVRIKP